LYCNQSEVFVSVNQEKKGKMQVFVRGVSSTFAVELEASATVADLKAAIEDVEFIPADTQRIVFNGSTLVGKLFEEGVKSADTVVMLLDVAGGMRAKWRKKRMRRLRRKRRKMRQRAR